ncbi:MAG: DOMON-like domain-containing protein [Pseudomonadales bacterium]|jgi:hypothetical protein|nr:DOMON-like domain-containing protein [Pseudomonadales bacterium]
MRYRLTEYSSNEFVTFELNKEAGETRSVCLNMSWRLSVRNKVIWPEYTHDRRGDNLWRSTCLEIFLGQPGASGYLEINLSPSGAWNAYSFTSYREGMAETDRVRLVGLQRGTNAFEARLQFDTLPMPITVGPAAVIEKESGALSYFALKHGDKPDFHNAALHQRLDHL